MDYGLWNRLHEAIDFGRPELAEDLAITHKSRGKPRPATLDLAHADLGRALLQQGQFAEARQATQQCLKLLPAGHPLRKRVQQQLHKSEKLQGVERQLDAYLAKLKTQPE